MAELTLCACAVGFGQGGGKEGETKKRRERKKPVVILEDGHELPPSSMEASCSDIGTRFVQEKVHFDIEAHRCRSWS